MRIAVFLLLLWPLLAQTGEVAAKEPPQAQAVKVSSMGGNRFRIQNTDQVIVTRPCPVYGRKLDAIIYSESERVTDDWFLIFVKFKKFCQIRRLHVQPDKAE